MLLRDFAEQVLHGERLDDKLVEPGSLVDDPSYRPREVPPCPGRPLGLRLDDPRARPPSPRRRDLDTPSGRGRVLHAFANHELLALELMAAMLLRFPDAPRGWRLGLAQTMRDEQRHLQLYLQRMAACGVEVGEVAVSSFFWDTLADSPSPLAFTAAMGLGFEQANLDFALAWKQAFAQAGDEVTAALLAEVYADEVRHVRHGVRWFDELSGAPLAYGPWEEALRFPMSPARARGPTLDRVGRARAGMSEAYIDRLEVAGASRGRPPVVYRMSVGVEDEVAGRDAGRAARAVQPDLQHLPLLVTLVSDIVIADAPSVAFLQGLREAGFTPGAVHETVRALPQPVASLQPWGWSPAVSEVLQPLASQVMQGPTRYALAWRPLYSKAWAARFQPFARVAHTVEEARAALPDGPYVVKAAMSAAGTRRLRDRFDEAAVGRWLAEDGAVVVQPWFERVVDLSAHGWIDDEEVRFDGVVRFATTSSGVFRGVRIGPWLHGLPAEVQRFAHGGGRSPGAVEEQLQLAWRRVAIEAQALGLRGPLGVDAMIVREEGGLGLVEVVEVNPRWTMGRLGWMIRQRLSGRARGWWRFHPVRELGDPGAWLAARQRGLPLRFDGGRLVQGAVATTDPARARRVLSVLELDGA